jgi:predicted nucleic acid-binding protein
VQHLATQNLVEFWAAITRPVDENGLGLTTKQAMAEVDALKRLFIPLQEVPIHEEWERLVVAYRVSGKNTHDARLVAAMIAHGVGSILTFNLRDFTRYREITAIDPRTLA